MGGEALDGTLRSQGMPWASLNASQRLTAHTAGIWNVQR